MLLFKLALNQQLFHKEMVARATDTYASRAPFNKWVDQDVAPRTSSFLTWMEEDRADNLVWRTMRSGSELRWLQLVEDAVVGTMGDSAIKMQAKSGVLPADALNQGAFLFG